MDTTDIEKYQYAAKFTDIHKDELNSSTGKILTVVNFVFFAIQMHMGIHQMPIIKSYISKKNIFDTPVFYKCISHDRYKFL